MNRITRAMLQNRVAYIESKRPVKFDFYSSRPDRTRIYHFQWRWEDERPFKNGSRSGTIREMYDFFCGWITDI